MKCNYCQERIISSYYTCPCDYNVMVCSRCNQFPCYKCSQKLKKYQAHFCSECRNFFPKQKVIIYEHSKYCLECILKACNRSRQKQVKISYHYIERSYIEKFLLDFCVQCKRFLKDEQKQNLSPLRVQISTNFKRCHECLVEKGDKQRLWQRNKNEESIHGRQEQNKPPLKYKQKINEAPQSPQKNKENKEQYQALRKKWQQIQLSSILKCMTCEKSIFSNEKPFLTQQMVICSLCSQMSKIQEKSINRLNNSRMISSFYDPNDRNNKHELQNKAKLKQEEQFRKAERQYKPQIKQSIIQPIKQPLKEPIKQPVPQQNIDDSKKVLQEKQKQEQYSKIKAQKQSQIKQSVIIPVSQGKQSQILPVDELQKQIINKKQKIKPQRQQQGLKKCDSQKVIQNIQIQIKLTNDQDLIQCDECGIYIQPTSSIWQEQSNKPLCRCCFADLIRSILQEQKKSYYNKYDNLKYKRRQYMQRQGSSNKKQGNQNVIDMPKQYQSKQKYEEKKFLNLRQQSAKKIRGVSLEQKQKLRQQMQQQERNKAKNMRVSNQGIKSLETWNQKQKIHLSSETNKLPFDHHRLDLVDDIKKKMQQNQNKKLIEEQNTSNKLTSPVNRYKSSQKPVQSSPQQPMSKPSNIQFSYLKSCYICRKQIGFHKQYKIDGQIVCLECMTLNTERINRLKGRPIGYK